jgi:hypothetical protein
VVVVSAEPLGRVVVVEVVSVNSGACGLASHATAIKAMARTTAGTLRMAER